MNKNILSRMIFSAALLLFATCTQDELTNSTDALPEGMYPLQISGITLEAESSQQPWGADAPQTRVSENSDGMSSKWDGDETIHVKLGNQETTYEVVDANGSLKLTGNQLYWTKRTDNVKAWYASPETDGTINLANQGNELVYVLQAKVDNASCDNPVTLNFTHALAKVRVVFSDESTADLTNASVSVLAPTSYTVNKGYVAAGSTTDYISMHKATYNGGKMCYEANVTPNLTLKDNAFQLTIDSKTVNCSTSEVLTQAGQLHVVTLTVNEKMTEVNVAEISGTEYTVSGNVHLKGNGQNKDLKLKVEAGSKVILENVVLDPNATGNVITCEGNATITLIGTNNIKADYTDYVWASAIKVDAGTLTIDGEGILNATGTGYYGAGILATNGASIIINGGQIIAQGGSGDPTWGYPGIGSQSGNITINGGTINAIGGAGSSGIGRYMGEYGCKNILITGENTIVTAKGGTGAEDIAAESVTFTGGATVNGKKYN